MGKICYYAFGVNIPFYLQYIVLGLIFFGLIKKLFRLEIVRLLFVAVPFVFFFIRILRNDPFFLSDDFAHLQLVYLHSYGDIFKLALAPPGIWVGHRIFLGFWLFKLIFDLFKLNPIPYQAAMFLINLTNGFLFYFLVGKILKSKNTAALMSFVFGFFYISWISNIHEVLALSFVLGCLNFYLSWLKKFELKFYFLSLLFYVLALFTKEITFLIFPVMVLLGIGKLKKNIKYILPFSLVFVAYSIFFASGFVSYFKIPHGTGYSMSLSLVLIFQNLGKYFTQIFPKLNEIIVVPLIFFSFIIFDTLNKKIESLPFLISYLILVFPALFFSGRISGYYNYIPVVFLLTGIGIIFEGIFFKASNIKNIFFRKAVLVTLIVFLTCGLFGLNKKMMDGCFLIQFPWKNAKKQTYLGLVNKIDDLAKFGKLAKGLEISIGVEKANLGDEMDNNVLQIFLGNPISRRYTYSYNPGKGTLIVE